MTPNTRAAGWLRGLLVAVSLGFAGCPDSGSEPASEPCDPLKSSGSASVELVEVVAIGRAADGTLFAVDQHEDSSYRLFVSEGDALVRSEGSASTQHERDADWISFLHDGDTRARVVIELRGNAVRMAIFEGDAAMDREFDLDRAGGELLTIVGDSALADLEVVDLPGDVFLEYSARVEDGRRMVVIHPEHDWTFESFRLFLGPEDRLVERTVREVLRQRDGGSTSIKFEVDSEQAEVFFPNRITRTDAGTTETITEPVTLKIGSRQFAVERLPREEPDVDELTFVCAR